MFAGGVDGVVAAAGRGSVGVAVVCLVVVAGVDVVVCLVVVVGVAVVVCLVVVLVVVVEVGLGGALLPLVTFRYAAGFPSQ